MKLFWIKILLVWFLAFCAEQNTSGSGEWASLIGMLIFILLNQETKKEKMNE